MQNSHTPHTKKLLAALTLTILLSSFFSVSMEKASAASTWSPTLLVNTEAFQIIDSGDGSTNIELRFGETGNRRLLYDVGNNRFQFTQPVFIQGNLTATGSLSVKRSISGALLRIDGNADIWGALSATGAIKTKTGAVLNSDNDTNDVDLKFGNTSGVRSLKFVNTMQRFEFNAPLWVNGNLSASGTLSVQDNINTRANLSINNDAAAADATITFGNASGNKALTFSNGNQRFEFNDDLKTTGNLSGKTLTIDDTVTLNGVSYEFTNTQGGANTFLRNDGAGNLTWGATSVGNGSGDVLTLHPEYAGAVYYQSGSTAVGTMTYSSSGALDNFYRWTSTRGTLQDYWMAVRVQVPKNFSHFESASGITLRVRSATTSAAANYVTARLKDTMGADVAVTNNAQQVSTVANTWRTHTITGLSGGTYAAGGFITVLLKVASTSSGFMDVGALTFNWATTTP